MRLSNLILSPIVLLIALLSTAHAQDTTPPTANIATTNEAVISGTASDNVALDRIELAIRNSDIEFWNGTAFGNYTRVPAILQADGTWQYQFSPKLPPDDYVVVSFAFDSAGNVQNPRDVANFSVLPADNSPPTATTTLATSLTVAGNASDNISLDRVELEIRNSSTQFWNGTSFGSYERVTASLQPNGEWQYQFSPTLPAGNYIVITFAFDTAGNVQSPRNVKLFSVQPVDSTPPIASVDSANASQLSGTASDNVALDRVELAIRNSSLQYWNGSGFGSYQRVQATLQNNGNWQYNFTSPLPIDDYAVVAFAFDTSNNVQSPRPVHNFTVQAQDTTQANATINFASGSLITGTASDDTSLDRIELAIGNSSAEFWNGNSLVSSYNRVVATLQSGGGWQYQLTPSLPTGTYAVTAFAFDSAGNVPTFRDTLSFVVSESGQFISTGQGSWGNPIGLPSIPVSAANLPDGKILTWAGYNKFMFQYGQDFGETYTTIFDPSNGSVTESLVSSTEHDMFCPGASMLPNGSVLVTGGSSVARTSVYNPASSSWSQEDTVNIPRAYNANTTLQDGSVLTLGGSWAEETLCRTGVSPSQSNCPDKLAEVWDPNTGWRVLSGISSDILRTDDSDGLFRSDNHMWLFTIPGNRVLHAGPSKTMHLLATAGEGSVTPVGNRADDNDAMNGNAVMYDVGKILTTGGATEYEETNATNDAFLIEYNGANVDSRRTDSMAFRRAYHNSVVLPNGEIIVVGGQTYPVPFSDNNSILAAELWNPVNETFRTLASMSTPRNYHSIALLLYDGRVLAGGGGLCGNCTTNHADVEIFTPPYLLDGNGNLKSRPNILSAPGNSFHGEDITVVTDQPIDSIVIVRAAVVTHSVNNDQRRIPLQFVNTSANNHVITIPSDPGIAPPGNYLLFVLDANGTPSVAKNINVQ